MTGHGGRVVAAFATASGGMVVIEGDDGVLHFTDPTDGMPGEASVRGFYRIGQKVETIGGERFTGEVRAVFTTKRGALRYVIEHELQGGGAFLRCYSDADLAALPSFQRSSTMGDFA